MTTDMIEIEILSPQPAISRSPLRTEIPLTEEYLKVRAYGEQWNALQRLKRPARRHIPYAEKLLREVERMLDQ